MATQVAIPLCSQLSRYSTLMTTSDIDIVYGSETITLHYDQDLDSLATVSVDRNNVPTGGQVHVTVSDFRLNLDPTGEDVWVMYANGSAAYDMVNAAPNTNLHRPADITADPTNWAGTFGGSNIGSLQLPTMAT